MKEKIIECISNYRKKYDVSRVYDDGMTISYFSFQVNLEIATMKYYMMENSSEISKIEYDIYDKYYWMLSFLIDKYVKYID